jgi:uncharacterized protein
MKVKTKSTKSIIQEIKEFARTECEKPTSKYGSGPFEDHFVPMVKYARQLAREYKADIELVELAGWLHDMGSIIYGREKHHLTSAKIAEKKLKELDYPEEKIEHIKNCIISHRGSQSIKPKTIEAQIIIESDTLSAFDDLAGLFECAYAYEKLARREAEKSVKQKLENKWKQLRFKKSKKIIRPKYEAIKVLLK